VELILKQQQIMLELDIPILYYFPLPDSSIPVKLWTKVTLQKSLEPTTGKHWILINESGFIPK